MAAPASSFGADSQHRVDGSNPAESLQHTRQQPWVALRMLGGRSGETDQLISSNASSRPLSWAIHGQPQQRPEQRPQTLRRRTRICSCSAAQAGPATAAGTAPRAPYAASADGSCGRSPRACRHALVRQKLRSDVRSRCGRSHDRRAGRHDPAATRASAGCMPCRGSGSKLPTLASWLNHHG